MIQQLQAENDQLRAEISRLRAASQPAAYAPAPAAYAPAPAPAAPPQQQKKTPSAGHPVVAGAAGGALRGAVVGAVGGAIMGDPGKGAKVCQSFGVWQRLEGRNQPDFHLVASLVRSHTPLLSIIPDGGSDGRDGWSDGRFRSASSWPNGWSLLRW